MSPSHNRPYALAPGEGSISLTLGLPGRAKSTDKQTGGAFSLVETLCPPGYATPLHIHYVEDEAIYVLGGALVVFLGNEKVTATSGSYIFQPRGIAHGFRTEGGAAARILCLTIPASCNHSGPDSAGTIVGFETPSADSELETLADLAARYKIEVLGPLPGPKPE